MSRDPFPQTEGLLAVWADVVTDDGEVVQRLLGVYRGTRAAEEAARQVSAVTGLAALRAFEIGVDEADWESGFVTV